MMFGALESFFEDTYGTDSGKGEFQDKQLILNSLEV